ncbi:type II secretion system protein GspD [Saccharobesus litoralis]|uniref:Type II secretion system protein GspD n=1 Tax=Saccharobesus litoralis TaxID=2172099 RepID=A0A2S0VWU6_9ALTE|nr:type II secretion system secretin GspD [Saccharobesus litoralis]AWB68691.1 type II secretion system protein GspD [Saccharobesus litoralis]
MTRTILKKLGIFSSASLLACLSAMSSVSAADYSPNFKGTDLNEFINIVGKNLKKTIIVDPNVRGKVNVRSYDLLNEEQYFQFFLNVLEVYGYAVIEMPNGVLKVKRDKDAKTSAIPVVDTDVNTGDTMVTRVVPVFNVSVKELSPLLRQLNDQAGGGNVVHYDPSNVIMITGRSAVVNRLVEIIKRVDKAGDQDVEIIKLQFASAAELVRIIEAMMKSKSGKDTTPDYLIPKIVADERTNSIIVSGELKARARITRLISQLDSELETSGNTKVIYLKYAKAEDLVKVLKGVSASLKAEEKGSSKSSSSRSSSSSRDISIEAHEDSNSLVITAQPDMMRSLESVIRQLDVRRAQVQVEAIIVEVFDTDGLNLGVQWGSEEGGVVQFSNGANAPIGALAAAAYQATPREGKTTIQLDSKGDPVTNTEPDELGDVSALAGLLGGLNGMAVGVVKDGWGAVLQAVSTSTNSNILATPSLTTMDNEEASVVVGQEVPTITGSTSSSSNSNPFQTVDRKEVGIKLKVTPQINEGTGVQMVIEQEVSSVAGATSAVDVTFNKREIKTTVMADDGSTIVLGGLIDEDVQKSVSKVPLLGDIPLIGELFKSTSNTKRKRNLLVFIRPTIIRTGMVQNQISHSKYNFMRAQQIERKEDSSWYEVDYSSSIPVLPEWKDKDALPPKFENYLNEQEKFKQDTKKDKE